MIGRCECRDPGCPVCHGQCKAPAAMTLYRVDMEDSTGTDMCEACASDALEAGVFATEPDDDDEAGLCPRGWDCIEGGAA